MFYPYFYQGLARYKKSNCIKVKKYGIFLKTVENNPSYFLLLAPYMHGSETNNKRLILDIFC